MAIHRWGWHLMWMATATLGACNGEADRVDDEEVCRDACARIAEGQDCLDMAGNSIGACEEGLICGFTTRRAELGEACVESAGCAAGGYCDPTSVCAALPAVRAGV